MRATKAGQASCKRGAACRGLTGRVSYRQAELATTREKLLVLEEPREDPVALLDRATAERNSTEADPKPRPWWLWGLLLLGIATVAGMVMFLRLPLTGS